MRGLGGILDDEEERKHGKRTLGLMPKAKVQSVT